MKVKNILNLNDRKPDIEETGDELVDYLKDNELWDEFNHNKYFVAFRDEYDGFIDHLSTDNVEEVKIFLVDLMRNIPLIDVRSCDFYVNRKLTDFDLDIEATLRFKIEGITYKG